VGEARVGAGRRWGLVPGGRDDRPPRFARGWPTGAAGGCGPEERTIYLLGVPDGPRGRTTLIHEIAHAVTEPSHGKKWQKRMAKAAQRADQLGFHDLADEIRKDIRRIRQGERPIPEEIYNKIRDFVEIYPGKQFSHVVDHVRRDYGFSRADFLRRFPKAKEVYLESQSKAQEKIYNKIKFIAKYHPGIQFSQVIDRLCREYSLSRVDFLRQFRKAKEAYLEAQSGVQVLEIQSAKSPPPENEAEKSPDCA